MATPSAPQQVARVGLLRGARILLPMVGQRPRGRYREVPEPPVVVNGIRPSRDAVRGGQPPPGWLVTVRALRPAPSPQLTIRSGWIRISGVGSAIASAQPRTSTPRGLHGSVL